MTHRLFAVMTFVAVALLSPAVHGAPEPGSQRPAGHAGGHGRIVDARARVLPIEVGKGRLVRLDAPAASVFIADPAIADVQVKSPTLVYVFGKAAGETTLFAVDGDDHVLANLRVAVRHNLSALRAAMTKLIPGRPIGVTSVGDAIMLTGVVDSAEVSEDARALAARFAGGEKNVLNRLVVAGPEQVNLRVRVAEVSRAVVKQIGINWDALIRAGSFAFGLATGSPTIIGGALATRNNSTNSVFGTVHTSSLDINAVLDALANEGLVTMLAEPNLTAVSGATASFLAGGEFPITVPQGDGSITVEFKKFGVGLAFTPTVLADGRINLVVNPEVSQISTTGEVRLNGIAIPALSTRRAETTVELGSGQSFAIAGLIQNNLSHDVSKFPGLGDLPVLGPLFRSDRFQRNETELVIIVTPYIVRPVSSHRMALPTDGFRMPSDPARIAGAPLYRPTLARPSPATAQERGRVLLGTAGFTLE